jgi:hypothetical protein
MTKTFSILASLITLGGFYLAVIDCRSITVFCVGSFGMCFGAAFFLFIQWLEKKAKEGPEQPAAPRPELSSMITVKYGDENFLLDTTTHEVITHF